MYLVLTHKRNGLQSQTMSFAHSINRLYIPLVNTQCMQAGWETVVQSSNHKESRPFWRLILCHPIHSHICSVWPTDEAHRHSADQASEFFWCSDPRMSASVAHTTRGRPPATTSRETWFSPTYWAEVSGFQAFFHRRDYLCNCRFHENPMNECAFVVFFRNNS